MSARAHRHQPLCSQSQGLRPAHSLPSFLSLTGGTFYWKRQGPARISWCLVDLGACHPAMPVDPSESQQSTRPRSPLLSHPLLNKRRVPVALPCPPAGSPTLPSPLPDLYPTLPWSYHHFLLHPVDKVLLEASIPAFSLFLCWAEGQGALSSPHPHAFAQD